MKLLFSLFVLSLCFHSQAASQWKPVAKTVDCPEKIKVFAKTGEKHILVEQDGKKHQLNSNKDEAYSEESLVSHQFVNEDEKMIVTLPGYVERNPPKFDLNESGKNIHCRMNLL